MGHFEEQLLRFLAVYLQRHDDLRVSLFLLHYGSSQNPGNDEYDNSNNSNSNIAAMRRIVNRILLDFHLSSGRIRYEMATDVHQLDLSAIRHCDILHVQDIQRQNAMVGYPDTPIKTTTSDSGSASGSSNSQERRRMVSWTDLYAILRVRLTEPTLVIYATDDTRAFEQVTVPLQETIPVDLQSSLTWLASSIVFDGQVQYDVPEVWEEADLPQHIKSSCGRLVCTNLAVLCVSFCDSLRHRMAVSMSVSVSVSVLLVTVGQPHRGYFRRRHIHDYVCGAVSSTGTSITTRGHSNHATLPTTATPTITIGITLLAALCLVRCLSSTDIDLDHVCLSIVHRDCTWLTKGFDS